QKTALALEELREALHLPTTPHRIECYDISNISGTSSVGSMVVLEDGRPKSSDYRRFRIKTVEGSNDVASLQEVIRRRFKRLFDTPASEGESDGDGATADLEATAESSADGADNEGDVNALENEQDALPDEAGASADMAGDPWGQLPDLVIVDGGRPQLNAALEVIAELPVGIPVIG